MPEGKSILFRYGPSVPRQTLRVQRSTQGMEEESGSSITREPGAFRNRRSKENDCFIRLVAACAQVYSQLVLWLRYGQGRSLAFNGDGRDNLFNGCDHNPDGSRS